MRLPAILALVFCLLLTCISAVPAARPDMALSVRANADVEVYQHNHGHDLYLAPRALTASTMIYFGLAPVGMTGAYLLYQNKYALGGSLVGSILIVALIQSITGMTLFNSDLKVNFAENEYRLRELAKKSRELPFEEHITMKTMDKLYEDIATGTKAEERAVQAHDNAMKSEAREAGKHVHDMAEKANKMWKNTFKERLSYVETMVKNAQAGETALSKANAQYEFAIDTTQELEDRQEAQKKATTYLDQATSEISKASAAWNALRTKLQSQESGMEDSTLQALREEMEKVFAVTKDGSSENARRSLMRSRSHIPRLLGSVDSTCTDESCPQLWYSASASHGQRRSAGPSTLTHDFFIIPHEYNFQGPGKLVRRDQKPIEFSSENCEFSENVDGFNLFGRLSLQEGNSSTSALILNLMSMDEIQTRVMNDVKNVPNVTEHGLTFSQMEQPGTHCVNIAADDQGAAIRGVYVISDDQDEIHRDLRPSFAACEASIG